MRILGIDPGLHLTGYGLVDATKQGVVLVEAGVIRTNAREPLPRRLGELYSGMCAVLADGRPSAVAIEDVFAHPGFPRTAIIMGHVCGVIGLSASLARVPVDTIAPAVVKRAMAASGRAGKRQLQRMVRVLLDLEDEPGSHVADALALALVAASRRGAALRGGTAARGIA